MLKRSWIVLLALLIQAGVGHAKPELAEVKAFRIYHSGSQNGEAIFIITSDWNGIVSSPMGLEDVGLTRDAGSITFGSFSFQAFRGSDTTVVIHDVWNDKKQGFRSVLRMRGEETTVGHVKPIGRFDSRPTRSLSGKTSFRFYNLEGRFEVYDLSNGKRVDGGLDSKFSRNGDLLFVITGHKKGRGYGDVGSSELDVFRDDTSIVFLETTLSGNKQITIIQNRWNKKYDGFGCTYIRNTLTPKFPSGGMELIRSIFKGVAKPQ